MQGDSLLSFYDTAHRNVFTTTTGNLKAAKDRSSMVASDYSEPFFSMGSVSVIVANHSYKLNLATNEMSVKALQGHTLPLADQALPELEDMRLLLVSHLLENGYEVSSLQSEVTDPGSE